MHCSIIRILVNWYIFVWCEFTVFQIQFACTLTYNTIRIDKKKLWICFEEASHPDSTDLWETIWWLFQIQSVIWFSNICLQNIKLITCWVKRWLISCKYSQSFCWKLTLFTSLTLHHWVAISQSLFNTNIIVFISVKDTTDTTNFLFAYVKIC